LSPFLRQSSKTGGRFKFISVTSVHLLDRSKILLDLLLQGRGFSRSVEKRDLMLLHVMEQLSNRLNVFDTLAFLLAKLDRDVLLFDE
jgi:hypothetical protein